MSSNEPLQRYEHAECWHCGQSAHMHETPYDGTPYDIDYCKSEDVKDLEGQVESLEIENIKLRNLILNHANYIAKAAQKWWPPFTPSPHPKTLADSALKLVRDSKAL